MSQMYNPTPEGQQLISAWLNAKAEVDRTREQWSRSQTDMMNAENALVAWMLPDAIQPRPGEKISIWAGDSLIQVEVGGVESGEGPVRERSSTRVTVRFRGKKFDRLR